MRVHVVIDTAEKDGEIFVRTSLCSEETFANSHLAALTGTVLKDAADAGMSPCQTIATQAIEWPETQKEQEKLLALFASYVIKGSVREAAADAHIWAPRASRLLKEAGLLKPHRATFIEVPESLRRAIAAEYRATGTIAGACRATDLSRDVVRRVLVEEGLREPTKGQSLSR